MSAYTPEEANRIRQRLFIEVREPGKPVRYVLRNERQRKRAEVDWWRHGVCLDCELRAITRGRCVNCGRAWRDVEKEAK